MGNFQPPLLGNIQPALRGYDESENGGRRPSFAASVLTGHIVRMRIPLRLLMPILRRTILVPEKMFGPVHRFRINWDETVSAS